MWGGLSIGYTYPPLRAELSKAGETGSRSVWMKKKKILEYIYNVLNRHESHPVVTTDRLGTSPREPDNEGHGAQADLVGGQMNRVVDRQMDRQMEGQIDGGGHGAWVDLFRIQMDRCGHGGLQV